MSSTIAKRLNIAFFVSAVLFTLLFQFVGIANWQYGDAFYWINSFPLYQEKILSSGTLLVGNLLYSYIAESLLLLRLVQWLAVVASLFIPFFALIEKDKWLEKLPAASVGLFLIGSGNFNEYSPHIFTVLSYSVIATLIVKFQKEKNLKYAIVASVVAGFAIWFKFPNILSIFVVCLSVFIIRIIQSKVWKAFLDSFSLGVLSIVTYWIIISLTIGEPLTSNKFISTVTGASSKSHDISFLIEQLLKDLYLFLRYAIYISIFCFASMPKWQRYIKYRWINILLKVVIVGLYAYLMYDSFSAMLWYNIAFLYYTVSIVLAISIYGIVIASIRKDWTLLTIFILFPALVMLAPMGSDTAWMKAFPLSACFIPTMAALLLKMEDFNIERYCMVGLTIVTAIYIYTQNPFGPEPLQNQIYISKADVIKPILVSKKVNNEIDEMLSDWEKYGEKGNTLAVGQKSHTIVALTKDNSFKGRVSNFYYFYNDRELVNNTYMKSINETSPTIFMFKQSPLSKKGFNEKNYFIRRLKKSGYEIVKKNKEYFVLKKSSSTSKK